MEIAQLEIFVTVAECGSITQAAKKMLRVPSNVSTRIKQLEDELGFPLFLRAHRAISLSPDGRQFLGYAERILALVGEAKGLGVQGVPRGSLKLGALESTAAVRIPAMLAEFHLRYPEVELGVEASASGVLFDRVLNGDLSAVFTDGAPSSPRLTGFKAFDERLTIISPPSVTVIDDRFRSTNPTVFVFGPVCSYRQRFEAWLSVEQIRPARVVEISSYYSMLACVASGGGLSMMPQSLLESLSGAGQVNSHPIRGSLGRAETWLMWRTDTQTAALHAFIDHIRSGASAQSVAA